MSHSQFHCIGHVYLDLHGLIFETSICYWQDQPGSLLPCRGPPTSVCGACDRRRPKRGPDLRALVWGVERHPGTKPALRGAGRDRSSEPGSLVKERRYPLSTADEARDNEALHRSGPCVNRSPSEHTTHAYPAQATLLAGVGGACRGPSANQRTTTVDVSARLVTLCTGQRRPRLRFGVS